MTNILQIHLTAALVTFLALVMNAFSASADNLRFVPQSILTYLAPIQVKFDPTDQYTLYVLNAGGRVDIFNILDWARPVKKLEIASGAQTIALSPDGKRVVSGGYSGTLRLWDPKTGATIGTPIRGHKNTITSIAFSPDGTRIASASNDGTVRLWHSDNLTAIGPPLDGRDGAVLTVAFSPDGTRIVSGGAEGMVRIWDAVNFVTVGKPLETYQPFMTNHVLSVAFSPDGSRIASGHSTGMVRLWNAITFTSIAERTGQDWVSSVAFSPDGTRIASGHMNGMIRLWSGKSLDAIGLQVHAHKEAVFNVAFSTNGAQVVSGGDDGTVRLWNVEQLTARGDPHFIPRGSIGSVAFSPDATHIVSAGYDGVRYSGTVQLLDSKTLTPKGSVPHAHRDMVRDVAFSLDGTHIVTGGRDGQLRLWDGSSLTPVASQPTAHHKAVTCVAFGPPIDVGTRIVSGGEDGSLRLWDAVALEPIGESLKTVEGPILSLTFSPDGMRIVSGDTDGMLRLWNSQTLKKLGQVPAAEGGFVYSVRISPDGTRIITGGSDGFLRLWDAETLKSIGGVRTGDGNQVLSVAFSPDGTRIVSGGSDKAVRLWNAKNLSPIGSPLEGHQAEVTSVAFSGDWTIASGSSDGAVHLWEFRTLTTIGAPLKGHMGVRSVTFAPHRSVRSIALAMKGSRIHSIVFGEYDGSIRIWETENLAAAQSSLNGHRSWVTSLAVSPDVTRIVSASNDKTVKLWTTGDLVSIGKPQKKHWTSYTYVAFSLDGTRVVAADDGGRDYGGTLQLWNPHDLTSIGNPLTGHRGPVTSATFSPDGTHMASTGYDATVRLWDTETLTPIGNPLTGHAGPVTSAAYSPDGTRIVSSSYDGTLRLWDAENLTAIRDPLKAHVGAVRSAVFSPDGKRIVSSGDDGTLRVWNAATLTEEAHSEPTCIEHRVLWVADELLVTGCYNRLVFFNSALERRGEVLLLNDGLVSVVDDQGIYASPNAYYNDVLAFLAQDEQVAIVPMSAEAIRRVVFDDWDWWSLTQTALQRAWVWTVETHENLGFRAVPMWVLILWVAAVIWASVMWTLFPSRLAWWAMEKDSDRKIDNGRYVSRVTSLVPVNFEIIKSLVEVVAFFSWLGKTKRPLARWLEHNRVELEATCFVERSEVKERRNYLSTGNGREIQKFLTEIASHGRGLLWIHGVGGSGKSALAMHMLRNILVDERNTSSAPLPVLISSDWQGSLAAQVGWQLRRPDSRRPGWWKYPTEEMVKTLGLHGLICPLVDSLSERRMHDAEIRVAAAVEGHFRHIVVTSRRRPDEIHQSLPFAQVEPRPLQRENVRPFITGYLTDINPIDLDAEVSTVERRLAPLFSGEQMPRPLYLRLAIEQVKTEISLTAVDPLSLVLGYVGALPSNMISSDDMQRAAAVAAVTSVEDQLVPQEFSRLQLRTALAGEANGLEFADIRTDRGVDEVSSETIVDILVQSGLLVQDRNLQFAYDPVAEYLAAWWVKERNLGGLRGRIIGSGAALERAWNHISHAQQ